MHDLFTILISKISSESVGDANQGGDVEVAVETGGGAQAAEVGVVPSSSPRAGRNLHPRVPKCASYLSIVVWEWELVGSWDQL